MGLLASSVYLLARLGYTCTLEYGGQKNALDEAIGMSWVLLVGWYISGKFIV
jgi:hypothetical protein